MCICIYLCLCVHGYVFRSYSRFNIYLHLTNLYFFKLYTVALSLYLYGNKTFLVTDLLTNRKQGQIWQNWMRTVKI